MLRKAAATLPGCKPMLSDKRRDSLGSMYSLVGSHSAVKLCRWQKSMMRGRGGCYKWSFYGIRSHRCMEATPSMACANKCVFCWRHNTNPTAKEWKWDVDEPVELVDALITQHQALIQNSSGMPGVTPDRLEEARLPQHCALSLVGEPIIYPRFNEFLARLHDRGVSTFVVNNGQFPDALAALGPCTQLYLSVDGPDRDKMKKLDRPVFEDFWERFKASAGLMKRRRDRSVFRLTMIKDFNMDDEDVDKYRLLFEAGAPDFIELKQLTPAFNKKSSFLRVANVPSWGEIVAYAQKICDATMGGRVYRIAACHEHSHCLLLARADKFLIDGTWHTWIDFARFHELVQARGGALAEVAAKGGVGIAGAGTGVMDATDFMLPTPEWAVWGAAAAGFDPDQQRHVSRRRAVHLKRELGNASAEADDDDNDDDTEASQALR